MSFFDTAQATISNCRWKRLKAFCSSLQSIGESRAINTRMLVRLGFGGDWRSILGDDRDAIAGSSQTNFIRTITNNYWQQSTSHHTPVAGKGVESTTEQNRSQAFSTIPPICTA